MSPQSALPILIVEDSPEDYEATVRAFRRSRLANPIYRCAEGDEALDYLRRRGRYADPASAPRPGLILLDLNLPGTDGREVLGEIKGDEGLRTIPVVVLTTSTDERDVQGCYRAGANSYVVKPVDVEALARAVQRLQGYWFDIVLLPRQEG